MLRQEFQFKKAVNNGDAATVERLLNAGISPNTIVPSDNPNTTQDTALHAAIREDHPAVVELLMSTDSVDLAMTNVAKLTPVELAQTLNRRDCLIAMAKKFRPLGVTIFGKDANTLAELKRKLEIQNNALPKVDDIIHAIVEGNVAFVQNCLAVGFRVDSVIDENSNTLLHRAVACNQENIIQLLLANDAPIGVKNSDRKTPLCLAVNNGDWDTVLTILSAINPKNNDGLYGLASYERLTNPQAPIQAAPTYLEAVQVPDLYALTVILNRESKSCDALDNELVLKDGHSAYHLAIDAKRFDLIKFLMQKGITLNKVNKSGYTPIQYALRLGHQDIINFIGTEFRGDISELHPVDANIITSAKFSMVHDHQPNLLLQYYAAIKDDNIDQLPSILSEISANTVIDEELNTGLHAAMSKDSLAMLELLIKNHAVLKRRNKNGLTPIQLAAQLQQWDKIKYVYLRLNEQELLALSAIDQALMVIALDEQFPRKLLNDANIPPLGYLLRCAFSKNNYAAIAMLVDQASSSREQARDPVRVDAAMQVYQGLGLNLPIDKELRTVLHCLHLPCMIEALQDVSLHYNPNRKNSDGLSALQYLISLKRWDAASFLIRSIKITDKCPALYSMDFAVAYEAACKQGEVNIVRALLKRGVSVSWRLDAQLNTGMHLAVLSKNIEMIRIILVQAGNEVMDYSNLAGESWFEMALALFNADEVTRLIQAIPTPLRKILPLKNMLVDAVQNNHLNMVENLLKLKVSPDVRFSNRNTLLHEAVEKRNWKLFQLLMANKVSIIAYNKDFHTPLDLAVDACAWDYALPMLKETGNDISKETSRKLEAQLIKSIEENEADLVLRFLKAGVTTLYFYRDPGKEHFAKMMKDASFWPLIQALVISHPDRAFHELINAHGKIPESIADIFNCIILLDEIKDAVCLPQGASYERSEIVKYDICPQTRNPFDESMLVENKLFKQLVSYYKLPGIKLDVVPELLVCPGTGSLFVDPVVAGNGVTYERAFILAYLKINQEKLPDGSMQPAHMNLTHDYTNRVVVSLIETLKLAVVKVAVASPHVANGLFADARSAPEEKAAVAKVSFGK